STCATRIGAAPWSRRRDRLLSRRNARRQQQCHRNQMLHTRVLPASLSGSMKGGADPFIFLRAVFDRAAGERRDNVAFVLIHETAEDETAGAGGERLQPIGGGDQQSAGQIRDDD